MLDAVVVLSSVGLHLFNAGYAFTSFSNGFSPSTTNFPGSRSFCINSGLSLEGAEASVVALSDDTSERRSSDEGVGSTPSGHKGRHSSECHPMTQAGYL